MEVVGDPSSFEHDREITVINRLTGETLLKVQGKMFITATPNQLEIITKVDNRPCKQQIGLNNNIIYIVRDL